MVMHIVPAAASHLRSALLVPAPLLSAAFIKVVAPVAGASRPAARWSRGGWKAGLVPTANLAPCGHDLRQRRIIHGMYAFSP
jgi:hypothetical protein